jgi:hypothetical protein
MGFPELHVDGNAPHKALESLATKESCRTRNCSENFDDRLKLQSRSEAQRNNADHI